ncbi:hypothetical protein [Evansella tamaricis]|uniref:Uncharacterized protein n=1 Tax=Evansella tamaricis TaxID=2069301 RepID=A0ABS6JIS9_9BACI|nr:hypothetical protein [Evansella tamaricis]MBU9713582.1 hypothetical protein [Evansella tamaricis]
MKVINISEMRRQKQNDKLEEHLREFDDYYEYCFMKGYEMNYEDFKCQAIQFQDIFVNLMELKDRTIMISLMFPTTYDLHEVAEWLDSYTVSFNEKDNGGYFVNDAEFISESLLFKGNPIVIAARGKKKLYYEITELTEITDYYHYYSEIVNTANSKEVDPDSDSDPDTELEFFPDKDDALDGEHPNRSYKR